MPQAGKCLPIFSRNMLQKTQSRVNNTKIKETSNWKKMKEVFIDVCILNFELLKYIY